MPWVVVWCHVDGCVSLLCGAMLMAVSCLPVGVCSWLRTSPCVRHLCPTWTLPTSCPLWPAVSWFGASQSPSSSLHLLPPPPPCICRRGCLCCWYHHPHRHRHRLTRHPSLPPPPLDCCFSTLPASSHAPYTRCSSVRHLSMPCPIPHPPVCLFFCRVWSSTTRTTEPSRELRTLTSPWMLWCVQCLGPSLTSDVLPVPACP
jgi:hypothetical protein